MLRSCKLKVLGSVLKLVTGELKGSDHVLKLEAGAYLLVSFNSLVVGIQTICISTKSIVPQSLIEEAVKKKKGGRGGKVENRNMCERALSSSDPG